MDQKGTTELSALQQSIELMARLRAPDGCPWDREQTFDSIKRHTLEETYEVFDAIDRRAWPELKDELGDLLLQVLFYAQMASEAGYFDIADVAANLNAKLIRRHPHIFGSAVAATAEDVRQTWEEVKREERRNQENRSPEDQGKPAAAGLMARVPQYLPAMLEAEKLGAAAAKVGFDWSEVGGVVDKLREETAEVEAELAADSGRSAMERAAALQDEVGDLFFTAVHLARHLHIEPEFALRGANRKFRRRFAAMEQSVGGADALTAMDADALDRAWNAVKMA